MVKFKGVGIGVVGTGAVALDHARAAVHLGGQIVAGTCSSAKSPRWNAFHSEFVGCDYVSDADVLASRADVDFIVLSLPWQVQVQQSWVEWGLSQVKPVLIEKPIALDEAMLMEAVGKYRNYCHNKLVAYNRRYYRVLDVLRARIKKGGLRAADISLSEDLKRLAGRGGVITALHSLEYSSCHILDAALSLFDELSVIHMTAYEELSEGISFINYNGILETASRIPVAFYSNSYDPCPVGIRCKFDDGTFWCLTPNEVLTVYSGYEIVERSDNCPIRRYEPRILERHVEDATFRPGFLAQMEAFLSGDFGPGCRPDEASKLLKLVSGIKSTAFDIGSKHA